MCKSQEDIRRGLWISSVFFGLDLIGGDSFLYGEDMRTTRDFFYFVVVIEES